MFLNPPPQRRLASVVSIAAELGVSVRSLERWTDDPRRAFPAFVKLGRRNFVDRDEVAAWLARQPRRGVVVSGGPAAA